ncbi:HAD family hydrolase [Natronomonas marina]|uniref:HAD family hydrolase n=1 Tax=Natronomonas marina TaxID=2961939 RepID=UPI0020C948D3|nr:HAD-IA family hydrolase [Natronomonas marina]
MPSYDAVLFDNDGVLVEPPAAETQRAAIREAFRSVGVADPADRHVDDLTSGVTVDVLEEIGAAYGVDPERLWLARERHDDRSQREAFRAGNRECYDDVEAVLDGALPSGVVSNNHHTTIEFLLDHFGWDGTFDTYYGREMSVESLERKKPNTHYVDRALSDLDAASALYVGDSATDVVAADRAGLDSAFVRRPHTREVDLPVDATHEVESLHDVAALLDG